MVCMFPYYIQRPQGLRMTFRGHGTILCRRLCCPQVQPIPASALPCYYQILVIMAGAKSCPSDRIVWWGCGLWMWEVEWGAFAGGCRGLLGYAWAVKVCMLGGCEGLCGWARLRRKVPSQKLHGQKFPAWDSVGGSPRRAARQSRGTADGAQGFAGAGREQNRTEERISPGYSHSCSPTASATLSSSPGLLPATGSGRRY